MAYAIWYNKSLIIIWMENFWCNEELSPMIPFWISRQTHMILLPSLSSQSRINAFWFLYPHFKDYYNIGSIDSILYKNI